MRFNDYFLLWPTAVKEQLPNWKPITMALVEVVEVAMEGVVVNCAVAGKGKGGQGGGSGSGQGSGGGGGKVTLNGVDVSNPNRTFSKEKWDKLKGNWQYIGDKRNKKGGGNPAGGQGHGL